MTNTRPLLVVLSGPSGAGKDAVLDELASRGHAFHRVVTCTTRPPRATERQGIDYHFVSQAEFDALLADGGLLEHATVYGESYGVPKQQVLDKLSDSNLLTEAKRRITSISRAMTAKALPKRRLRPRSRSTAAVFVASQARW